MNRQYQTPSRRRRRPLLKSSRRRARNRQGDRRTARAHQTWTPQYAAIPFATPRTGSGTGCGHVLLEGVPRVAKTLVATTIAQAIAADFQRVSHLTWRRDRGDADLRGGNGHVPGREGPIFTNPSGRRSTATPKTQSAAQAMQGGRCADVSADPFWVLATENPVEQAGSRCRKRSSIALDDGARGYPSADEEVQTLRRRLAKRRSSHASLPGGRSASRFHPRHRPRRRVSEHIVRSEGPPGPPSRWAART